MKTMVKFNEDYSAKDKDYLKEVINFYVDCLNFEEYSGKLYIIFADELPTTGLITEETADVKYINRGVFEYKIIDHTDVYFIHVLSTQSHQEHIKTLFHELCHVYQYASGKQKLDNYGRIIWNKTVPYPVSKEISYQDYLNLPWEIEARSHEEVYYTKWLSHESKKKFWYEKYLDTMFNCVVYCATACITALTKVKSK